MAPASGLATMNAATVTDSTSLNNVTNSGNSTISGTSRQVTKTGTVCQSYSIVVRTRRNKWRVIVVPYSSDT